MAYASCKVQFYYLGCLSALLLTLALLFKRLVYIKGCP